MHPCLRAGVVFTTSSTYLRAGEVACILQNSSAGLLVASRAFGALTAAVPLFSIPSDESY